MRRVTTMALETIAQLPGKKDINDQFTAGPNIHKALACFKKIQRNGTYEFGTLTACFYNFPKGEEQTWLQETKIYPQAIRDDITKYIVEALTHQTGGKDDPIPFTMIWTGGSPQEVKRTYDPYTIEIIGCPPPLALALAERRERKSQ
jgi:hypothetical protein